MGLEIPSAKVPGTVVRTTAAPRPAFIGLLIVVLTVIIFVMGGLTMYAVLVKGANNAAAHDPAIPEYTVSIFGFKEFNFFINEQTIVSFWLAVIFFSLFELIFLYQRFFVDHVTIAKRRFRKWEDEGVQLHD